LIFFFFSLIFLSADLQPYFALPWVLTWMAHDVESLPKVARIFDFFIASHSLMPLYFTAAVIPFFFFFPSLPFCFSFY